MHAQPRPNPFADLPSQSGPIAPAHLASTIAAEVRSLIAPRQPNRRLLATLSEQAKRPLPRAQTTVRLQHLRQQPRPVPSRLAFERMPGADRISLQSFVIYHPEATILLDPAVPRDVHERVLPELSALLRQAVRPPASTIPTLDALAETGVVPDVALATHAHWDHVSGLLDLPDLPAILSDDDLDWAATGNRAPAGGVRQALAGRSLLGVTLDGPPVLTFARSRDLFGDGSVVLVDLAGHTPGSIGVLLATDDGPVLLAGDVAWHGLQIENLRQRSGFPGCLVDEDRDETWHALHRLHALPDSVRVIPAHDHDRGTEWARA